MDIFNSCFVFVELGVRSRCTLQSIERVDGALGGTCREYTFFILLLNVVPPNRSQSEEVGAGVVDLAGPAEAETAAREVPAREVVRKGVEEAEVARAGVPPMPR